MLTLDRVLEELSQQSTDVTNVVPPVSPDIEAVEPFNEVTTPFIDGELFEATVSIPMPWIRAQLW